MAHSTKAKSVAAFSLALLLLFGSGCATHRVRRGPRLFPGRRGQPQRVCTVVTDPMPYGYYETSWHPWPGECTGYPTGAIDVELKPGTQGAAAATPPGQPSPAPPMPAESEPGGREAVDAPGENLPVEEDAAGVPPDADADVNRADAPQSPAQGKPAGTSPMPDDEAAATSPSPPAEPLTPGAPRKAGRQPTKSPAPVSSLVQPATFVGPPASVRGSGGAERRSARRVIAIIPEPSLYEPSLHEQGGGPSPGTSSPTNPDSTDADSTDPNLTYPDLTYPDLTYPDPTAPDLTDPDLTYPDPTAPDPTDPDPTDPEPTDRAIVRTRATGFRLQSILGRIPEATPAEQGQPIRAVKLLRNLEGIFGKFDLGTPQGTSQQRWKAGRRLHFLSR